MFKRKPPVAAGEKYCHACESAKPLAEFHRARAEPDGHTSQCKACKKVGTQCMLERKAALEASYRRFQECEGAGLRLVDLVGLDVPTELAA